MRSSTLWRTHSSGNRSGSFVDHSVVAEHDRVVEAPPFDEARFPKRVDVLLAERTSSPEQSSLSRTSGVTSKVGVLGADVGVIVLGGETHAERRVGHPDDLDIAAPVDDRPVDLELGTGRALVDQSRLPQRADEIPVRPVPRLGRLAAVDFDIEVVDPEPVARGEQVLDRVHEHVSVVQRGAPVRRHVPGHARHERGYLDGLAKVRPHETNARPRRRGFEGQLDLAPGVKAAPGERKHSSDRPLLPHHAPLPSSRRPASPPAASSVRTTRAGVRYTPRASGPCGGRARGSPKRSGREGSLS
jgi:hypothetical protein